MKTNDKDKMSLSRTVPDQVPTARPRAAGRKVATDSSTSGLLDLSITKSTEQSENVYENKGQAQKSGSADRRFCGLRLFHERWGGLRTAITAVRATPKSAEQSENVCENKGQVQKVADSPAGAGRSPANS